MKIDLHELMHKHLQTTEVSYVICQQSEIKDLQARLHGRVREAEEKRRAIANH